MAQIGIHRLSAGNDEHKRAHDQQRRVAARLPQKPQAIERVEGGQDLRLPDDLREPQPADNDEPDQQDRPEHAADAGGALELHREQRRQQNHGDRNDEARQRRRRHAQSLDSRQHTDRRCDEAIAEQQSGAEHQRHQQGKHAPPAVFVQQAIEGEHAALTVILRAQHQQRVFYRDDDRQCPDHQRDPAEHVGRSGGQVGPAEEDLVQSVQRRCADIPIDDAERAHRQGGKPALRRVGWGGLIHHCPQYSCAPLTPSRKFSRPTLQGDRGGPSS